MEIVSERKKAYREFLRSEFWLGMSATVRARVGCCQKCGSRKLLQAHHVKYRDDWYKTKEVDLLVLCRVCHAREHGLSVRTGWRGPEIIYRDDWKFSVILHRIWHLSESVRHGKELRARDERFLDNALELYPPEPKDRCMQFHVDLLRSDAVFYEMIKKGWLS